MYRHQAGHLLQTDGQVLTPGLPQEISLKIITCDEDCTIRMFDFKSGGVALVLMLQLLHACQLWRTNCMCHGRQAEQACFPGALFAECPIPHNLPLTTVRTVCCFCICS